MGDYRTSLGIRAGHGVIAATQQITQTLTGWTWAANDILPVATMLSSQGTTPPTATTKLTDDMIRWNLDFTVRLVGSSPYFLVR